METTLKRLYVGGISPLVTKTDLADRFGKFGKVYDVDIIYRKDDQGNPIKTFAYLNINISDLDLKKCISVLNKTKWKGGILQIEIAKESFLHRLSQERQETKEKEKANTLCSQNDLVLPLEKIAVPGTEVPNHKNWVVSKFGRVLPVLHFNGKKHSKIMKYDPSKYCHNIKKLEDTFKCVPVSQLTWKLDGGDDKFSRKSRGEFSNVMPSLQKKKKLIHLPMSVPQTDKRIPFGFIQSDIKMTIHSKKFGHLQNRNINSMIDEYDSEEELESVLKRERAARVTANFADDSYIEVVDDSFKLSYTTHWAKQKATPKIHSTCNTLHDGEYDSAHTNEIMTVAKTVQKSWNSFKTTKADAVSRDELRILESEGSTYAHGKKNECRFNETDMSKLESDSKTDASEEDSSLCSDEEYKAMMQNCLKLDLTMRDLETLAKEANEFDNENDNTENDHKHDTDKTKQYYDFAENPGASEFGLLPTSQKIQDAKQPLAVIKKKCKPKSIQSRALKSDRQSNCKDSKFSDSLIDEHCEFIKKNSSRNHFSFESLKPKSSTVLQCLFNHHEMETGIKGETDLSKGVSGSENVKKRKSIEPEDIVASIMEDDCSSDQESINKKKLAQLKPPAFKGLSSVLASETTVNLLSRSSTMSSVDTAAVTKISNDLNLSSCTSKRVKKAEEQPIKTFKNIFLEGKSNNWSSSIDTRDECNSDSSSISSAAKPSLSQVDATKEQTTPKVKQQQDNEKRLLAMMERRKERELQKQIIQGALLHLDHQCLKKSQHIVFSSESASEKEEDASTSEDQSVHAENKAKQSISKLFNSSEEDSDNGDKEDNERFEIKAQYEGRSGIKLMQLQSHFGIDERFKMDVRFLESSSEDEEALDKNKSQDENDLLAEKKKNLGILQSILNINMESQPASRQTTNGKKFKDQNALHYDPANEEHATFATKAEEKKESKYEKSKKQLVTEKLPDVSKETFHEIIIDFKELFGASTTRNSMEPGRTWDQQMEPEKKEANETTSNVFRNTEESAEFTFSFFGNTAEGSTSNNEPYKIEINKPVKVAWQEDPRFQDSSSEGEDEVEDANVAIDNKTSIRTDISSIPFFFFVKDDQRLKTGPTMFFRSCNPKQEEKAWEQRKNLLLEECRKRHKDAKRKIKARN